ncbi:RHS repeat-associated core domain-containing protein, partial [Pseudomonas sp.]|uniref:RHS repeat-associated core domain-containing protein n=1 Tax=Pseudomonas sp. TaxID=306 RepID=UPI00289F50D5
ACHNGIRLTNATFQTNPNTGHFLTPDPIKLAGGLNNYQYVPNPTGWVDPLGLNNCPGNKSCEQENVETPSENAKVSEDVVKPIDPYDEKLFGHAFTKHGQNNTEFLKRRSQAMNRPNGQWLDDSAAAEFVAGIKEPGTVVVELPKNVPARLVNPDGTFTLISKATIVRKGNGKLITAFPGEN